MITPIIPSMLVQRKYSEYLTNADLTTTIPFDDTIPQNTEGTEILTATITPRSATNRIRIRFQGQASAGGTAGFGIALFVDSTASALAASQSIIGSSGYYVPGVLEYEEVATSLTARTYKIRVGGGSTIRLNGQHSGRIYGGTIRATLIVEEIIP